ncbi:MAG: MFS transporter [Proteobacteria bacterium]|nr:MFS transporter [Pseudomonadota bacterium]
MSDPSSPPSGAPGWLTLVMAAACGLIVANLYYAQPLIGPIAAALALPAASAGLIVTSTQCGYGLGLLFVVPLADRLENRRLIVGALLLVAVALVALARARDAATLLAACALVGFFAVAAQVIVPFASHLAPLEQRGRAVGNVMSGLLLGIMLARPTSSLLADHWGWQSVFGVSAIATLALALLLWRVLPERRPAAQASYAALLRSMLRLVAETPLLRLRGYYQACAFAAFSLFWTTVPLHLAAAPWSLSQSQIALFALAGVAGAIAAPITGRLADRGWSAVATPVALLLIVAGFVLSLVVAPGRPGSLGLLVAAAIVLDMGVSASLLLSQRAIYALGASVRGRLNGLFMAMFFAGGALGSSVGAWSYATGGWTVSALIGGALPLLALAWLVLRGARAEAALQPT